LAADEGLIMTAIAALKQIFSTHVSGKSIKIGAFFVADLTLAAAHYICESLQRSFFYFLIMKNAKKLYP